MKRYEVTISVRLHGIVTVEAESEQEAEDIVGMKFNQDEIKLSDLEFADETRIDCVEEITESLN